MRAPRLILIALSAAAAAACGTKSPTSPSCNFTISLSTQQFGPAGGTANIVIGAPAGCSWTAASSASWITIQGNATGSGSGSVTVAVAPSPETAERTGTIDVASQKLTVTQSACEYRVDPAERAFTADGGTTDFELSAQSGCRWSVEGAPPWATFNASSGEGSARISVRVLENSQSVARDAEVRIASARLSIKQAAAEVRQPPPLPPAPLDCQYSVTPVQTFARLAGDTGEFTISTAPGCAWTAVSSEGWLRVGTVSGSGSARIAYTVDVGPFGYGTDFRKAPIEVRWQAATAGQNVWVWQFPSCATAFVDADARGSYIDKVTFTADGGRKHIFVLVDSPFNCPWTMLPPTVDWLSASGVSISPAWRRGDADLFITLPANTSSSPRTTVLLVGEKPLTVTQAGR